MRWHGSQYRIYVSFVSRSVRHLWSVLPAFRSARYANPARLVAIKG